MFAGFYFHLRAVGLKVSLTEWLALIEALARGLTRSSLAVFYQVARALLVKRETQLDLFDQAFADYFAGVPARFNVDEEVYAWLENPVLPRELTAAERALLETWDLERLRAELEARLREQTERHDGGNYWVGTGGSSPFGHGGHHPAGVRLGGSGGGRSAVQVASDRRFRDLRGDRVLDTRQLTAALRRLRRLSRDDAPEELDLDGTIDYCARNAGDLELVFARPRRNQVKLVLLMDVGGSMDPHTAVCERLFSAARAARGFKELKTYFFHNCVYERLYASMAYAKGPPTAAVLEQLDPTWSLVMVGDAWMAPYELTLVGGAIHYWQQNEQPGLVWLERLRQRCPSSVWLNPEPQRVWDSPTIRLIRTVFPMFELTLDGLDRAVAALRTGGAGLAPAPQQPWRR